jgi:putative ABC transport system ATP-binding protein
MSELLTAREVTKTYQSNQCPALDCVSFSVARGEFAAIMGASGSGKTTLLNVLSTIDRPTGGDITIDGVNIANLRDKASSDFRKDKLGFIFQEYFLLDSLTVFENIAVSLTLLEIPHRKIAASVQELAERFGIASELHKYPNELSGGQRQRTAAARALVKNPSILFADEPTGALDSHSSAELLEMLTEANGGLNTTILMVTHDAYAASFAGRIILLKDGKIQSELHREKQSDRRCFYESILGTISKSSML